MDNTLPVLLWEITDWLVSHFLKSFHSHIESALEGRKKRVHLLDRLGGRRGEFLFY